jgi:hypothetical protein
MMVLGLKLVLAHVIGDFVFQPDKWVEDKKERKQKSRYLYLHLLIHALALCILLRFDIAYWRAAIIILVSYCAIDLGKLHLSDRFNLRILFF